LKDLVAMSKQRRIQFSGATYHIMSRGNRKARIFEDDRDRREFLSILADALDRYSVECPSYCLVGNHYHFVAHTPRGNIARFMKVMNGRYAQYINRGHRLTGHLFGGPYKRAFPSLTLEESQQRFTELVSNFPGELVLDHRDVVFGDRELQSEVRELIGRTMYLSDIPRAYRAMARPELSRALSCVTRTERITAIRRAHVVYGYPLSEIARCLEVHPTTISRLLAKSRNRHSKS
jgi:REP element-mobilizing transposase RayT